MAAVQAGQPDYPVLGDDGAFAPGNTLHSLYEKACLANQADVDEEGVSQLKKLHNSNLNTTNKLSFLDICKKSDPAGVEIPWRRWRAGEPEQVVGPPTPRNHPQYPERTTVAVCDFPRGTHCDCTGGICRIDFGMRYMVGVGVVRCGESIGDVCSCGPDTVEVLVENWLHHSQMELFSTVDLPPPSSVRAPVTPDEDRSVLGVRMVKRWPIVLMHHLDPVEYAQLLSKPKKKRGRPPKIATETALDVEADTDVEGSYSERDDDDQDESDLTPPAMTPPAKTPPTKKTQTKKTKKMQTERAKTPPPKKTSQTENVQPERMTTRARSSSKRS